jgi:hypothetical protein
MGFVGYRYWKKSAPSPKKRPVAAVKTTTPKAPAVRTKSVATKAVQPSVKKVAAPPPVESAEADSTPPPAKPQHDHHDEEEAADKPASYRVLADATPLRHRTPDPLDSTYAKKRRADKALWTDQQRKAIQQVQRTRIYGGQRTINRNVEILLQILRDREYNSAFESGKRPYLYDDLDWDASEVDGPIYEVRLTFSGGKEADGGARKPLKFAFKADLEQGTVEPGGAEQVRSNTLHAFFDESRIPPEDRRAIAKDTEELVQAAQPDASPLALDTVARQFMATYGSGAMGRIAQAYGLSNLTRKVVHEPKKVEATPGGGGKATMVSEDSGKESKKTAPTAKTETLAETKKSLATPSKGRAAEYEMTPGTGRQRNITATLTSTAPPARLYELLTGYDRLKNFVPDLLVSEKAGQDGAAAIVHTVSLSRFMFFVFKVNLHMRVIEHPQQHTIEFERIAGEFEQFRGSVEIGSDAATGLTTIRFRATVVPKGRMPHWVLRDMAKRFLVPILHAIKDRAEAT